MQRKDNVYENINIQEKFEDFSARKAMKKRSKMQKLMARFIQHNYTTLVVSLITLIVLYADDFRVVFLDKSHDVIIDGVLLFCLTIFTVELAIQSYCLPDYLWSFFFWLDLIAVLSMPMDIYFIMQYLSGQSESLILQTDDASNVARVGRASRVGTKAGRYIKLVKLIRIVKVAKFFKQTNTIQNKREELLQKKSQEGKRRQ